MNFPLRFWRVSRRDMNQHAGSENDIEKTVGIGNLKCGRQRQVGVLQPGACFAQSVILDFDPVKMPESHFLQRTQLVSFVAAYLEDARIPWYVRQKTLVEFSPANTVVPAVEGIESLRRQRIAVGIRAPEIALPMV